MSKSGKSQLLTLKAAQSSINSITPTDILCSQGKTWAHWRHPWAPGTTCHLSSTEKQVLCKKSSLTSVKQRAWSSQAHEKSMVSAWPARNLGFFYWIIRYIHQFFPRLVTNNIHHTCTPNPIPHLMISQHHLDFLTQNHVIFNVQTNRGIELRLAKALWFSKALHTP